MFVNYTHALDLQ